MSTHVVAYYYLFILFIILSIFIFLFMFVERSEVGSIKTIYTGENYNIKLYTQTTTGPKMAPRSELVARPGF